ncbi:DUF1573 domain-containing protein [Candidatus Uabimicrobium sp. HlEnr_7]|uniref:DUF1573 domain-containing protein n=1 Tax=Candidatus Uabimicrobium helgolandensis TaxID=3095367 RepID=UPI0035563B1F
MKKILIALLFCPLFLFADKIADITPKVLHLNTIKDTDNVSGTFILKNTSGKTLQINRVKTFCGCTYIEPKVKTIAPGNTTKLTVKYSPKGKQGPQETEVHVFTNLQENPLVLRFDATVLRNHFLSDDILSFGEFRRGKQVEKKIWLSPLELPNFRVKTVELKINEKNMTTSFSVSSGYGYYDKLYPGKRRGFWVKVRASKDIDFGKATGNLVFITNIPQKEVISLPFFAKVAGDISLSRDHIGMGMLRKGKKISRNLMVYPTEESERVVVQKVKCSLPFISAKIFPIIENQYYEIKFVSQLSGREKRGEFRGKVTIHTSNEKQPVIVLPIQGFIR